MAARSAWVLNLDADLELAKGPRYAPTRETRAAMAPHIVRLAKDLLGPDDLLVDDSSPHDVARGLRGRCFCPTPRALGILRRAGATIERHPSFDVLRAVNSRAFASALGQTLPGAIFTTSCDDALYNLRAPPPLGVAWRVKHAFGMAGRNQRVVDFKDVGAADEAFVQRGLASGGAQIEPNVAITDEFSIHGLIESSGTLEIGRIVVQHCDANGVWIGSELFRDVTSDVPKTMREEAERVGSALYAAGYFGPFGIDGYRYHDARGTTSIQPRSEINARYSMAFGIGFPGLE